MFRGLREFIGYEVQSQDEQTIGEISDILFDDVRWVVRYLVIDTENGLKRGRKLLSPMGVEMVGGEEQHLLARVNAERIASSPDYGDNPITRQQEIEIHAFYQWPAYWDEANEVPPVQEGLAGWSVTEMMTDVEAKRDEQTGVQRPALRSFNEAEGYEVRSRDEMSAGRLYDLIVHEDNWRISYMIISTGGILPGRKIILSPASIVYFDWENERLDLDLTHETIEKGQEYNEDINFDETSRVEDDVRDNTRSDR